MDAIRRCKYDGCNQAVKPLKTYCTEHIEVRRKEHRKQVADSVRGVKKTFGKKRKCIGQEGNCDHITVNFFGYCNDCISERSKRYNLDLGAHFIVS